MPRAGRKDFIPPSKPIRELHGQGFVYAGPVIGYPLEPLVKFVKKANMYVTTTYINPKKGPGGRTVYDQKQVWSATRPI